MSSSRGSAGSFAAAVAWVAATMLAQTGCGLLGDRKDPPKVVALASPADGCLNALGAQVRAFYEGSADPVEWTRTWDCVQGAFADFSKITRGSVSDGYTLEDMEGFAGRFLVTNQAVSHDLVVATFRVKATLLGGTADVLTRAEIDDLVRLLGVLKEQTLQLIEPIAAYRKEPGKHSSSQALGSAMSVAAKALSASIRLAGNPPIDAGTLRTFASEANRLHGFNIPLEHLNAFLDLKALFADGDSTTVRAEDVYRLLDLTAEVAAPVFRFVSLPVLRPDSTHAERLALAGEYAAIWKTLSRVLMDIPERQGGKLALEKLRLLTGATAAFGVKPEKREWIDGWLQFALPLAIDVFFPAHREEMGRAGDGVPAELWRGIVDLSAAYAAPALEWVLAGESALSLPAPDRDAFVLASFQKFRPLIESVGDVRPRGGLSVSEVAGWVRAVVERGRLGIPVERLAGAMLAVNQGLFGNSGDEIDSEAWHASVQAMAELLPLFLEIERKPVVLADSIRDGLRAWEVVSRVVVEARAASKPGYVLNLPAVVDAVASFTTVPTALRSWIGPAKIFVFGGDPATLTPGEWAELGRLLGSHALRVAEAVRDLGQDRQQTATPAKRRAILGDLFREAAREIPAILERADGRFPLERLALLPVGPKLDQIEAVKRLVLGGDPAILTAREWVYLQTLLDSALEPLLEAWVPDEPVIFSPEVAASRILDAVFPHLAEKPSFAAVVTFADVQAALSALGLGGDWPSGWEALKELWVGGDAESFTSAEWVALLGDVRDLLPLVGRARAIDWKSLTADEWESRLRELFRGAEPVLTSIPGRHPGGRVSVQKLGPLFDLFSLKELRDLFGIAKPLLVGGARDTIASTEWMPLWNGLFEIGTQAIWLREAARRPLPPTAGATLNLPQLRRQWGHVTALRPVLGRALALHGGSIAVDDLGELIAALPADWIAVDRKVLTQTLKPVVNRLLHSGASDALDLRSVDHLIALGDRWIDQQSRVEDVFRIFDLDPLAIETSRYVAAAESYLDGLPSSERESAQKVLKIGRGYRALFPAREWRIRFEPNVPNSLHNLSLMLTLETIAEELLSGYSSVPGGKKGTVDDLRRVLDDGDELAFALKIVLPNAARLAEKRFREADLLVFGSDGDGYLSVREIAAYLAFAVSATNIYQDVLGQIEPVCLDEKEGQDELGHWWMGARCFRSNFYPKYEWFWKTLPGMVDFWSGLSTRAREAVIVSIENGTRLKKYSDGPLATYDAQAVTGIFQYVEALFVRMDSDWDGIVTKSEALSGFPVFRRSIAELASISPEKEGLLEAVFLYLLRFGEAPDCSTGGKLRFLWWWKFEKPFAKITADRARVYEVLAMIGAPGAVSCGKGEIEKLIDQENP